MYLSEARLTDAIHKNCSWKNILPPTEAGVGLKYVFTYLDERFGRVRICVDVKNPRDICPIQFPFNISLSTRDGSAGK